VREARPADDLIVMRKLDLRPADVAFWTLWAAVLAAFVALAVAVYYEHPLPFDLRATLWVQDLERAPCVAQFAEFANTAGDGNRVAALAGVLFVFLVLMGRRFEAAAVAGVIAVRLVQLAIRHTIDWPNGQAAYFETHRQLPDGGSFLSGHVLGQVLAYGLLFAFASRLFSSRLVVMAVRAFCALVIVLGGPARLYVGAHWPSDVIGAALLAALYLMPVLWLDARRVRGGELRAPGDVPNRARSSTSPSSATELRRVRSLDRRPL
jgi:undecaprenyl-diphosphatase